MGEENTVKNGKLFLIKGGKYEEITCNNIRDIHIEDELSHRSDLIDYPQTISFSGKIEFRVSLLTWIRLLGFSVGFKTWLRTKFCKR